MPHPESNAVEGEQWRLSPYRFKPLWHNGLVAGLALQILKLRTRRLERVIFTATTGRSGTFTLARLFSAVPDAIAVHEPHPVMNGSVLQAASFGDTALVNRVYHQIKAVNIRRVAAGHRYYLEANHLFIKTFIQNAIDDFGGRLAIVHLVRPAVEVATSIDSLRDYPGTARGNYWWLDYHAPTNLISIADVLDEDPEFSQPFYKALWYWYEVEARIAAWRARMPGLKIVRFETDWLNDLDKVCELLDSLGVQYEKPAIAGTIGTKEHLKTTQKIGSPLPAPVAEQMAVRFRELLQQRLVPAGALARRIG